MLRTLFVIVSFALAAVPTLASDPVAERLESSPRHHEWVKIEVGDRVIETWVVFPEVSDRASAVVVIHENKGLTDWVRGVADQLAESGYVALAPDLLSGTGPGGGGTSAFPDRDAARQGIYALDQDGVTAALDAVADYAAAIPAADGTVSVAGFCWGGRQTFQFATHRNGLTASYVFYGTAPGEQVDLATISAPVHGFYGGDDARVTSTVEATVERMRAAGTVYEPVTFEGAGHGFMRSGEAPDASEANRAAHEAGWARWLELLGAG